MDHTIWVACYAQFSSKPFALEYTTSETQNRTEAELDIRQFFAFHADVSYYISGRCSSLKNEKQQLG